MHTPIEAEKVTRVSNAASVATTDVNSTGVDMLGFEWVLFTVLHGSITDGTPDCFLQQSDDDGSSDDYTSLASTLVAVADDADNKLTLIGVARPSKRYVRVVVDRAGSTGSVVDGIIARQGGATKKPVTQPSSVQGSGWTVTPAEGTP